MFQRLKGFNLDSFLDTKIAEEQAKQAQQSRPSPAGRRTPSSSGSRRASARTDSPSKRPSSRLRATDSDTTTPTKAPDPEDFVIGDDASDISRAATPLPTPQPVKEDAEGPILEEKQEEATPEKQDAAAPAPQESGKGKGKEKATDDELPEDVRKKLAKLDALTARYQDLLRNYRTAHARVAFIEPFEATLREHTPLTSISDPGALVEFLNQRSVQSEMVMEELKRVSAENRDVVKERDELGVKLEDAEKRAKEAFDEAAGLQRERGEEPVPSKADEKVGEDDPLGAAPSKEPEEDGPTKANTDEDETFFSYETELPRLESEIEHHKTEIEHRKTEIEHHKTEIQQQTEYILELSTENASLRSDLTSLRSDLDQTQLDLNAMENKIGGKDREIAQIQIELGDTKSRLEDADNARQDAREHNAEVPSASHAENELRMLDLQNQVDKYKESLEKYQQEHDENLKNGTYVQREEKMKEIHQNVVNALKEQVKEVEEAKRFADGTVKDLQFRISLLEGEANTSGALITDLRGREQTNEDWKKRASAAEHERDEAQRLAESKKGHEAAVASLRSQLKRAEKDRDAAYQMIIDCGKCIIPEKEGERSLEVPTEASSLASRSRGSSEATEQTEASTQPTEVSTPSLSVDGELAPSPAESKKKNRKKKSKGKKKEDIADATSTTEPLTSETSVVVSTSSTTPPSIEELIKNPQKANEILSKPRDDKLFFEIIKKSMENLKEEREKEGEEQAHLLLHHEGVIEERDQTIKDNARLIKEKDEEITELRHRIGKQEETIEELVRKSRDDEGLKEGLREEVADIRDSVTTAGIEATDAKHEVKMLKEWKAKLQQEFDEREIADEEKRKALMEAEKLRDELAGKLKQREKLIDALERERALYKQENLERTKATNVAMKVAKEACEKQKEELKAQHSANSAELDAKHRLVCRNFDDLKSKSSGLETDLAAANSLAQSRFKDVTDLKEHLSRVQAELKKVKQEAEELRSAKVELDKASASVTRLEGRERDLRSEIAEYKSQISEKDKEVTTSKEKAKKSDERASALEDTYESARKNLEQNERTRDEAVETRDKVQAELKKVQDELKTSKSSLDELEKQVNTFRDDATRAKEELQLKSAQQSSAQSLMDSMQDQTRELATQMKEIKERNESLEEELADAHRLLSERGREGETMRRLLSEVEGRAESKVKEMRERMDLAVEERDRAEDEASTIGRRKSREIDDLKTKLRDSEREASRASEARAEAEKREREFQTRQQDLEHRASAAQAEVAEVRAAMAQLRDALDENERRSRDVEKEKMNLRKTLEEREARLEKLQKSSKSMAEELRGFQAGRVQRQTGGTNNVPSSRSSVEESSRVTSPVPRGSNGTPGLFGGGGGQQQQQGPKEMDHVYLKNVMLQFLEQKEKKHQLQLVPVLGRLLHFDPQDEQKWHAAIAAR